MWFWSGTSSASLQREVIDVSKQDFYSADHLLALLDSLPSFETIDEKNRDSTIEILRQIAEVLVWGEQHNQGYFDIFCEQNVLSYFVQLAEQRAVPNAVKVQLLQTLSIIVQSINKDTAVYYMFSNNYINALLSTKFDFEDEEVTSWYVSFIKSLSLLVNPNTIKLFLNERAKNFPIYSEAVKFFIAKDSMVRTHCRNVTLSIFKVQDPALRAFLLARPVFFSHVACYLRELLDRQLARLTAGHSADTDFTIRDGFWEIEEMLFYIQDIFNMNVDKFSDILAARLLVYCYIPVIGFLGTHGGIKLDGSQGDPGEDARGEVGSAHSESQASGSSEDESSTGSPSSGMESMESSISHPSSRTLEQGWMWGWGSPEDLQGASSAGEMSEKPGDKRQSSRSKAGGDLSKSWRARAAQAMSRSLKEAPQKTDGSPKAAVLGAAGECRKVSSSSAVDAQAARASSPLQNTTSCDPVRRLILFFLMQTLNCIQDGKLIRPIIAALFFHQLPRPLHDLLLAKAPAVPPAYNYLRNPTECSGHIELFLPTASQVNGDPVEWQDESTLGQADDHIGATEVVSSRPSSHTTKRAARSTFPFIERMRMLTTALKALEALSCLVDEATHPQRRDPYPNPEETPLLPQGTIWCRDSCNSEQAYGSVEWCHNPFRCYLLSLFDECKLAERQCDTCFMLLGLIVDSVLRHSWTSPALLMHASIIPQCGTDVLAGKGRASCRLCAVSAPSTPATTPSMRTEHQSHDTQSWASHDKRGGNKDFETSYPPASAPPTPARRLRVQSLREPSLEMCESTHYDRTSWSFTAHMLDAIQAHLSSSFLRPITVRRRCMEVLVERALKLRRSAAVATKLCLSALSDGHTIDVFWDEWGVHRAGTIDVSTLSRDFRILMCTHNSRGDTRNADFPPYLLVAVTDQEVERRSVQLFLLFRRLHRDLSTILQSVVSNPNDAAGMAQEAADVLFGVSSEPNPFESEDHSENYSGPVDSDSNTTGRYPRTRILLEGRNIIRCTVETSSGRATRYCVQDDKRLLLVSPSSAFPGVADIRTSHPLRNVECRLNKNSSRCLRLLVLDATPPADALQRSPPGGPHEKPPTMQYALTFRSLEQHRRWLLSVLNVLPTQLRNDSGFTCCF